MSSADSSVLSASTMFARNIYKPIRDAICGKVRKSNLWSYLSVNCSVECHRLWPYMFKSSNGDPGPLEMPSTLLVYPEIYIIRANGESSFDINIVGTKSVYDRYNIRTL